MLSIVSLSSCCVRRAAISSSALSPALQTDTDPGPASSSLWWPQFCDLQLQMEKGLYLKWKFLLCIFRHLWKPDTVSGAGSRSRQSFSWVETSGSLTGGRQNFGPATTNSGSNWPSSLWKTANSSIIIWNFTVQKTFILIPMGIFQGYPLHSALCATLHLRTRKRSAQSCIRHAAGCITKSNTAL